MARENSSKCNARDGGGEGFVPVEGMALQAECRDLAGTLGCSGALQEYLMHEKVICAILGSAALRGDEAEALRGVEPKFASEWISRAVSTELLRGDRKRDARGEKIPAGTRRAVAMSTTLAPQKERDRIEATHHFTVPFFLPSAGAAAGAGAGVASSSAMVEQVSHLQ